eukprot:6213663-Pleurochrysis_carterae.AAC.3
MEANSRVARGHDVHVVPGARGVNRHSPYGVRSRLPELVDRQERVTERGYATDIAQSELLHVAMGIHSIEMHVPNERHMLRFAVHAGNDLIRVTCVDEIAGMRIDVPRAPAVEYKRDSFASAATSMTASDAALAAGQKSACRDSGALRDDSRAFVSRGDR